MGGMFGGGGDDAGDAAKDAARIQADAQREALDYLKETERMPQQYREGALGMLGNEYGLVMDEEGNLVPDGSSMYQRALDSPFYQHGLQQGEESIARNAMATGGLRSGNMQSALADNAYNLYGQSYNQQLGGVNAMAQLPSLAPAIAGGISGIGSTLAQGEMAAGQAGQQGQQNMMGNLMGMAGMGMMGYGMFA